MTAVWLIMAFIGILLVKHFVLWHPLDVSHLYTSGTLKIGHRGCPLEAPENTIPSYQRAIEAGLNFIEIDVLSTADGKVVCSHDHDLERATDGYGYIHKMAFVELAGIDAAIKFPAFSPCKIPLFVEVLDNIPEEILLDIEIKAASRFDLTTAKQLVNIIRERDLYHRVVVSSFHPLVIGGIKWLDRKIPTAYIWTDRDILPKILRKPRFINLVHPDIFHPEVHLVDMNLVRYARRKGLKINVWTVNNLTAMVWLLKLGADGIISDFPELMHDAVSSIGEANEVA